MLYMVGEIFLYRVSFDIVYNESIHENNNKWLWAELSATRNTQAEAEEEASHDWIVLDSALSMVRWGNLKKRMPI